MQMINSYDYINVLAIPTDYCNMHCRYCFHNEFHDSESSRIKMSFSTLEQLMKIILPNYKRVKFIWHGGEPLLRGIDYFKRIVEYQSIYGDNTEIRNNIQSNLTLVNQEYIEFFKDNNFSIGGSYDGINNEKTRGNSEVILRNREMIASNGMKCGFICVVSNANVRELIPTYEDFKRRGIGFSLNCYIDVQSEKDEMLSLNIDDYISNIINLYDYWLYDTDCNIMINNFRTVLKYIFDNKLTLCNYTSCLGKWVCIRPDGTITPCNRYFPPEYDYGNVFDYSDLHEAFESEGFVKLLKGAIERRKKCIASCEIYGFCNGGCNNVAFNENGIENNGGFSCIARKAIYKHIYDSIQDLLKKDKDYIISKINPYIVNSLIKAKEKSFKN